MRVPAVEFILKFLVIVEQSPLIAFAADADGAVDYTVVDQHNVPGLNMISAVVDEIVPFA